MKNRGNQVEQQHAQVTFSGSGENTNSQTVQNQDSELTQAQHLGKASGIDIQNAAQGAAGHPYRVIKQN